MAGTPINELVNTLYEMVEDAGIRFWICWTRSGQICPPI